MSRSIIHPFTCIIAFQFHVTQSDSLRHWKQRSICAACTSQLLFQTKNSKETQWITVSFRVLGTKNIRHNVESSASVHISVFANANANFKASFVDHRTISELHSSHVHCSSFISHCPGLYMVLIHGYIRLIYRPENVYFYYCRCRQMSWIFCSILVCSPQRSAARDTIR